MIQRKAGNGWQINWAEHRRQPLFTSCTHVKSMSSSTSWGKEVGACPSAVFEFFIFYFEEPRQLRYSFRFTSGLCKTLGFASKLHLAALLSSSFLWYGMQICTEPLVVAGMHFLTGASVRWASSVPLYSSPFSMAKFPSGFSFGGWRFERIPHSIGVYSYWLNPQRLTRTAWLTLKSA